MPFLCVFAKQRSNPARRSSGPTDDVDESLLVRLLCPYRGDLRRFAIASGILYVTSLADVTEEAEQLTCVVPNGSRCTAATAWARISTTARAQGDGEVRFETDPLGTFPLHWFEDDDIIAVAGEAKAFTALRGRRIRLADDEVLHRARHAPDFAPFRDVKRVFPGTALHVSSALAIRSEPRTTLAFRPTSRWTDAAEAKPSLEAALLESASSIADGASGERWGSFLSGGVDSAVATALTKRNVGALETFTLGTEHGDEYADAEELSAYLGVENTRVMAARNDAVSHFDRAIFCNETVDGLTAETLAQLGVLAYAAAANGVRRIVTGYGADLLFGSMLRHALYMQVTGVDDLQSLIERTCWSGEFAPFYAWSLGVEIHHLFWHPRVMNCAFRIEPEVSFDGEREKIVLRDLAVQAGWLEHRHANRKKQALTDGTQFNRVLSTAFGFGSPHSYEQKNARCIARLRRIVEPVLA